MSLLLLSCKQSRKEKIEGILSDVSGKEWYLNSYQDNVPHYIYKLYHDGHLEKFYLNTKREKVLKITSKKNEKWKVLNDSIVEILSFQNFIGIQKFRNKILYFSNDTIILQGVEKTNDKSLFLFIHKKDSLK